MAAEPPLRAVIDIGSNSVLLLVARRHPDGRVEVVEDRARVSRLSQGVDQSGRLRADAIERTLVVLKEYRECAERWGASLQAMTTEAVRAAENPDDFLGPATALLGAPIRLLTGQQEAELSYLSVAAEAAGKTPLRVLDIGGGSTELVAGRGRSIESVCSHRIGSVRLTERLVRHDPPQPSEIDAIASCARETFAAQPLTPAPELVAIAGTAVTCGGLLLKLPVFDREAIDGSRFALAELESLRDELAHRTSADRAREALLGSGRADVVVAGATILLEALRHCGASTLVVRDRGLRFALV